MEVDDVGTTYRWEMKLMKTLIGKALERSRGLKGGTPRKGGLMFWVNAVVNARRVGDGGLMLQGASLWFCVLGGGAVGDRSIK